jgi:hypothetical protein
MRPRPTRPNVFRNLKRFGVFSTDWKYILAPTAVAYFLPFLFGLWVYHIPLGFPLGVLTFLILLSFFNFLRASKPECWMKHQLDAVIDSWVDFRPPVDHEFERADWLNSAR